MSEQVRRDLRPPHLRSCDLSWASVKWESCHLLCAAKGGRGREGDGPPFPPPTRPAPLCFGQMHKLREEKEHSVSQVQELEASVAELKNQIGKLGLEDLGAGLVAEGW